ncbi:PH domain-containing protein [Lederbergia citrea]|uniref:PH domain-containing protein n=1 Tax=Lederbergia citrea TaxID=2833581 RepID=UPI001BC99CB9|nr:PH domain-containing protein [Lederbergia citrea]MBS4205304.1 PH domain-containing protein [Lederbergia citrea]
MSEPKRLHPITMVFAIIKSIKDIIIPVVIWFFLFVLKEGTDNIIEVEGGWKWLKISPFIFIGIALIIMITSSVIKWLRFTYRVEDMELRIEHGLFIKKKRYIPFERIQSLDFSESLLHRPFGLVKVKVETAGGDLNKSEAEMSAIKKEQAEALSRMITEAKASGTVAGVDTVGEVDASESILYKISGRQLLFFASTSGRTGAVVLAILGFGGQFDQFIPFERFQEMQGIVKAGYLLLGMIAVIGLLLAWMVSVVMAYLKYNDFTLKKVEDDLMITRGLLEKRTTTIPIRRVQAVRITESLLRQPFGYASVAVEYAGGSILDENTEGLLMPVVKKKDIPALLRKTLAEYSFEVDFTPAPKIAKRRFYFIKMLLAVVVTVILSAWLWPYGLLATLFMGGALILGILQFKSAGWNITDNQLTLRYRGIDQQTVYMSKKRMQSFDISVNWFQKRAGLSSIETAVMSGGGAVAGVKHILGEDAKKIYEWYSPERGRAEHNAGPEEN